MIGNKHTFWQALIVALLIFWLGILIGIIFENSRSSSLDEMYLDSQTDIFDFELSSQIVADSNADCNLISEKSITFADDIYEKAVKLEKYDNSNKITKDLISVHRRYDLLRTMLWKDIVLNKNRCENNINMVIYLYTYKDPGINIRAVQGAMSNYLTDLKIKYGDRIILIPIAVDTNIASLDILREIYGLENVPVIFVNEKYKFETLDSLKDIESSLV